LRSCDVLNLSPIKNPRKYPSIDAIAMSIILTHTLRIPIEDKYPVTKSRLSPGRKKVTGTPDSKKMIAKRPKYPN
jgi:hypothetical protein